MEQNVSLLGIEDEKLISRISFFIEYTWAMQTGSRCSFFNAIWL